MVLISLDDPLLERLDEEARARGLSRSALNAELRTERLAQEPGPGARPDVQEALRGLEDLFRSAQDSEDATHVIRATRDSRWGARYGAWMGNFASEAMRWDL